MPVEDPLALSRGADLSARLRGGGDWCVWASTSSNCKPSHTVPDTPKAVYGGPEQVYNQVLAGARVHSTFGSQNRNHRLALSGFLLLSGPELTLQRSKLEEIIASPTGEQEP